ncbi:MAG TPA: DNA polymerase III subunit epsilon, partial [Alphaproteobacteria bacterium]|nr:DNA polymerase III subunit epsilon [Alphaproteobacteria bacterium]
VDASARDVHGALLDARLLASVYLELCGGRQRGLTMSFAVRTSSNGSSEKTLRPPRPHTATAEELAAHAAAIEKLAGNLWEETAA